MNDEIKTAIKEAIDIDFLIGALGIDATIKGKKELRATCPVHGGDNKTAFRMRRDKKIWTCFTRGCHTQYGNDVIGLVQGIFKCSFRDAVSYLSGLTGIQLNDQDMLVNIHKLRNEIEMSKFAGNRRTIYMPPEDVTEEGLEVYKQNRTGYFEQWYSKELLDYFEVGGGYVDKCGITREIVPIRDDVGRLVAFSGRALSDKILPKYLLTNGFDKNHVLYNLFRARKRLSLENNYTLIVVEGFKSVWYLYLLGYENVVACMGNTITGGQQNLILKNGVLNLVLLLDGDDAGRRGANTAEVDFKDKLKLKVIKLPEDGKPDGYPPEFIYELLLNVPN